MTPTPPPPTRKPGPGAGLIVGGIVLAFVLAALADVEPPDQGGAARHGLTADAPDPAPLPSGSPAAVPAEPNNTPAPGVDPTGDAYQGDQTVIDRQQESSADGR